jgi:hypothetical protein
MELFYKGGFYDFLHADISEDSIAVILTAMQTTITEVGQKKKGSVLPDEKAMSLKGGWFQVTREEDAMAMTSIDPSEVMKRNTIFQDSIGCHRVLSLYAKIYNKW